MENKAVIIDATRSPIGMKNGEMVGIRPDDLACLLYTSPSPRDS